ncbi:MAG: MobF family relaxase [Halothiobacillaceae bacterium]|nr:MobF family relaxase [Halothiobacillaceae bacterium]
MVAHVTAINSAAGASEYYAQVDDYYREGVSAPTHWHGKGAALLGLSGAVDKDQTEALLNGRLPNGVELGRAGPNGEREHKPGWDVTFSAPKSVSVAALVHGDDRLIEAHNKAVVAALNYLESEAAATRIRTGGAVETEKTGNLTAAVYRHATSREQEAQLHSHAIVINATQSEDGKWRSIESRAIYRLQTEAGLVYRAELAAQAERMGYQIEKTTEGGYASFELSQISKEEREIHSTRAKQIEAELAKLGLTPETASAEQKEMVKLKTRQGKEVADHAELREAWQARSAEAGFTFSLPTASIQIESAESRADRALQSAINHLSERETRFAERQIVVDALRFGMGEVNESQVREAIARAKEQGALIATKTRQFDPVLGKTQMDGFTTRRGQETEHGMLAASRQGREQSPTTSRAGAEKAIARQEARTGFAFNPAQRDATQSILTSGERVSLIQGYAGTAKTTSVLATSAEELRRQGYQIRALAPTHSAAATLAEAIQAEGQTVASFLNSRPQEGAGREVVIVDEASMLSTRDMRALLERTREARVILVGDTAQIGSVEAGAAFRQLQEQSGLKTLVLDEIVRQKNDQLKKAVYHSIRGEVGKALDKIEVHELKTREERVEEIVKNYTQRSQEERSQTMIIAPGRDDRREINEAVRAALRERGELGEETKIRALERRDLTREEQKHAARYHPGDVIQAGRDYKSTGLARGDFARVVGVDATSNRLTIQLEKGKGGEMREINPARFSRLNVYQTREMGVAEGDKIVTRANIYNLKNGTTLTIEKVHEGAIHTRDGAGKAHLLDPTRPLAVDHGYAQTGHESQGRTTKHVLIHAESHRKNLMSQQNFYVPISRATHSATVFTDGKDKLQAQIQSETGQKEAALGSTREHIDEVRRLIHQAGAEARNTRHETRSPDRSPDRDFER